MYGRVDRHGLDGADTLYSSGGPNTLVGSAVTISITSTTPATW